jgi:hypothetical protein
MSFPLYLQKNEQASNDKKTNFLSKMHVEIMLSRQPTNMFESGSINKMNKKVDFRS